MLVTLLTPQRNESSAAQLLLRNRREAQQINISTGVLNRLQDLTGLTFSTHGKNGHISLNGKGFTFSPSSKAKTLSSVSGDHFPSNTQFIVFGSIGKQATLNSILVAERQNNGEFYVAHSFVDGPAPLDLDSLKIISVLAEDATESPKPSFLLPSSDASTQEYLDAMEALEIKHGKYNRFIEIFDKISCDHVPLSVDGLEIEKYLQSVEIPPESYSPGIRERIITFCLGNPYEFSSAALGLNESLIDDESFNRLRLQIFIGAYLDSNFFISLARNKSLLKHPSAPIILESAIDYHPQAGFSVEFLKQLEELQKLQNLDLEDARALNIDPADVRLRTEILKEGFKVENHSNEVFFELGKKNNLLKPGTIHNALEKAKQFPNCTLSKGLGLNRSLLSTCKPQLLNRFERNLLHEWAKEHSDTEFGRSLLELFKKEPTLKTTPK